MTEKTIITQPVSTVDILIPDGVMDFGLRASNILFTGITGEDLSLRMSLDGTNFLGVEGDYEWVHVSSGGIIPYNSFQLLGNVVADSGTRSDFDGFFSPGDSAHCATLNVKAFGPCTNGLLTRHLGGRLTTVGRIKAIRLSSGAAQMTGRFVLTPEPDAA